MTNSAYIRRGGPSSRRPLIFLGSSRVSLQRLPEEVRRAIGHRLRDVQDGLFPKNAKPLRGNLSGLLELREDGEEGAFRVIYLVRFSEAVYVLHVFQKKSSHGIGIPQRDLRAILARLQQAHERHRESLSYQENA